MFLTRCRFEVDAVFQVHPNIVIVELKCDSKRASGQERAVGEERVAKVVCLQALLETGALVWTDGDNRKTQRRELGFDLAQLTELRIAIGSPATAVEDEQCTGFAGEFRKVDGCPVQRADAHRRHGRARLQGLGGFCVWVDGVCCGCQARDQQNAGGPEAAASTKDVEWCAHVDYFSTPGFRARPRVSCGLEQREVCSIARADSLEPSAFSPGLPASFMVCQDQISP